MGLCQTAAGLPFTFLIWDKYHRKIQKKCPVGMILDVQPFFFPGKRGIQPICSADQELRNNVTTTTTGIPGVLTLCPA